MKIIFFLLLVFGLHSLVFAQDLEIIRRAGAIGKSVGAGSQRQDTIAFEHRKDDTLFLSYRYLDSTRRSTLDSSINDFDHYYSVPSYWQNLGNNGAAATALIYNSFAKPGWDAGFHSFDLYRFTTEGTKLYKTNRPFSMLAYQLASGKEQMIQVVHTQNPRPNVNFGFDYRLINAPGLFLNQNNNHNAWRLYGNYQGKRKRYNGTIILLGSNIRASQNGGIVNDSQLVDKNRKQRFAVDVNLGDINGYRPNPFVTSVKTGNTYKDFTFFLRQSYDLGKKDSIAINDSTTEYLFYPKLRFQHTFTFNKYSYRYLDVEADSTLYENWFAIRLPNANDTVVLNEKWQILSNDFSLLQFPDTKNTAEFFLAGATIQNIKGTLDSGNTNLHNIFVHAEYRNRTRNKKWDILAKGELYFNGYNAGDYGAYASLSRYFNKRWGYVNLFFNNVNRSPSFIFDPRSSFNLGNAGNFKKENIISFGATANNPYVQLGFTNYLITNYAYFEGNTKTAQFSKPINISRFSASTKLKLSKKINWYIEGALQLTDAAAPIKVPNIYTRNRLAFEGKFYKNLILSTGLDVRYFTPYKAYGFSAVTGQFVTQDSVTIKNLPDVAAYLHFRIRGFAAYIRAENLNTVSTLNGFGFINNNFAAPHYPTPGLIIRVGIRWWFLN